MADDTDYTYTYARYKTSTSYDERLDGHEALPLALDRIFDRLMAQNPIQTVTHRLFHLEYRLYPEIALREALLNAFCHQDFRIPGPVLVSLYPDRLEIGNAGGFIGGIAVNNLLHHRPVPRNPLLVEALVRLRLVNRLNLGIRRMFESMLVEGKKPPSFIATRGLDIDHLLILNHLLAHPEATTLQLAEICQRSEPETRETLSLLESTRSYLERGGTGRGTYWTLHPDIHARLQGKRNVERDRRLDLEAAKARIHSVLLQRRKRSASFGVSSRRRSSKSSGTAEAPATACETNHLPEPTSTRPRHRVPAGSGMRNPGTW